MSLSTSELTFREIKTDGYEKVVEITDEESGLHAIIALHDTRLGPALGGIRAYPYRNFDAALTDVLRLAKGMTYKASLAYTGTGGGKSVIITDNQSSKPEKMLLAFAEAVNVFSGKYICAEDVGMSVSDLAKIRKGTRYAVGLPHPNSSGDPSPFTARGGFRGIQAVAKKLWGSDSLKGKTIAIQGLGAVGMKLAALLFWAQAKLIVTDIDAEKTSQAAREFGAKVVDTEKIYSVDCDIFAPCAMGAILNSKTIPHLRTAAVAGLANNQLLSDEDGKALFKRKILYAPDYVINAGGLINVCVELEEKCYQSPNARDRVETHIYELLLDIFQKSEEKKSPTSEIANVLAESNLESGTGERTKKMVFHH